MPHSTQGRALQRGVYTLPFLSRSGHPVLVAIDSEGRYRFHALVFRRDCKAEVVRMVRNMLDREDPA